jgi:beta-glucosidase
MRSYVPVVLVCVLLLSLPLALVSPAPKKLSSYDSQVRELLAKMTLEEKIGQMTQPEQGPVLGNAGDMQKYFIGSVLSGGDSDPREGNSLEAWTGMYDRVQTEAMKTRLGIPVLYGVDAVHGHSNVLGAVIFPHNSALGCTRDPGLIERISRITAKEVRATGIQWTFSPCVAAPQDIRWGRTYEGFSEDPALVRILGEAAVRGLQGNLKDPLSILACAKHYGGDGGTTASTSPRAGAPAAKDARLWLDQGDTNVDEATLRCIHLPGYIAAIKAGVGSIMPSYSTWNGVRCSASKRLLTEILKEELGFEGFLISDYNAIGQIKPEDYKASVEISINAGMDMAMEPSNYRRFFETLRELVKEGRVPMARIDDAVTRILRVKFAMGLMDKKPEPACRQEIACLLSGSVEQSGRGARSRAQIHGAPEKKRKRRRLPISKQSARIHVAAKATTTSATSAAAGRFLWQGKTGQRDSRWKTRFLDAIKAAVAPKTQVSFSLDGTGPEGASLGVVVVGEQALRGGIGDRADLSLDKEVPCCHWQCEESRNPRRRHFNCGPADDSRRGAGSGGCAPGRFPSGHRRAGERRCSFRRL